jgi:hypothetical protein
MIKSGQVIVTQLDQNESILIEIYLFYFVDIFFRSERERES